MCDKRREQVLSKQGHDKTGKVCFENLNRRAFSLGPLALCLAVQKYARQKCKPKKLNPKYSLINLYKLI